ncbi:MAG TPA: SDR family oxidoreductase [Alphaproteobacteria bacterium]|jgi:3-oxoacyl-[acyl-carrier protein] reductase
MEIEGGVAIVTGSATGIGAATARALAARGCRVVVNYTRSEAEAGATAAACGEAGVEAISVRADVSSDADCRALTAATFDRWGRIDVLVNNAGITRFVAGTDLDGLTAEDFQRIYAVNLIGPYQMARACAPHMKASGRGAIVNVSSTAGVFGTGSSIAYAASKGALNTLTLALARVLAPEIRVNAVCPGFVQTRWHLAARGEAAYAAHVREWEEIAPLRKAATPEDVAGTILSFIEGPDLVTGQLLVADAGASLGGRARR